MLPDRSLEIEAEGEAEATLSDVGTVGIADTPYIVEANQGKDVVKTDTHLHIRSLAHGLSVRQFGETIEVIVISGVILSAGIYGLNSLFSIALISSPIIYLHFSSTSQSSSKISEAEDMLSLSLTV